MLDSDGRRWKYRYCLRMAARITLTIAAIADEHQMRLNVLGHAYLHCPAETLTRHLWVLCRVGL